MVRVAERNARVSAMPRKQQPLFKKIEKKAEQKEQSELEKRRKMLQQKRRQFEPVDFIKLRQEAMMHDPSASPSKGTHLPPIHPRGQASSHYYQGEARKRVVSEHNQVRKHKETSRQEAAERRMAAQRYSKLVHELLPSDARPKGVRSSLLSEMREISASTAAPKVPAHGRHAASGNVGGANREAMMYSSSAPAAMRSKETLELRAKASALNDQARPTSSRTPTDVGPARARSSRAN